MPEGEIGMVRLLIFFCYAYGALAVIAAVLNRDWYFSSRRFRQTDQWIGRNANPVLAVLFGVASIALGHHATQVVPH